MNISLGTNKEKSICDFIMDNKKTQVVDSRVNLTLYDWNCFYIFCCNGKLIFLVELCICGKDGPKASGLFKAKQKTHKNG